MYRSVPPLGPTFSVAPPASAVIIFPVGLNAGDWKLAVFVRLLGIYRWSSISWCGRSLPRQTSGTTSLCLDVPHSASHFSLALSVLAAWSRVSTGTTAHLLDRPEFVWLQLEVCFLLTWQINSAKISFVIRSFSGWRRGVAVNTLVSINGVAQNRARLLLGWVTVCCLSILSLSSSRSS